MVQSMTLLLISFDSRKGKIWYSVDSDIWTSSNRIPDHWIIVLWRKTNFELRQSTSNSQQPTANSQQPTVNSQQSTFLSAVNHLRPAENCPSLLFPYFVLLVWLTWTYNETKKDWLRTVSGCKGVVFMAGLMVCKWFLDWSGVFNR